MDTHLPTFDSENLRIVCTSDTHNDVCDQDIPPGDIFIHAGDLTDDGTPEELQTTFDWICGLPHPVKVIVAGNHDLGLDPHHRSFAPESLELYRSSKARSSGIHYVDREVRTVALIKTEDDERPQLVRIYGNPLQPDFLNSPYCFTYKPFPSPEAIDAWTSAPSRSDPIHIWVMHGPPKDRLDWIDMDGLQGCVAQARPLLCIFGHYHVSNGVERVEWQEQSDEVAKAELLAKGSKRRNFDFGGRCKHPGLEPRKSTLFVNAAWMTGRKREVSTRNMPFVVTFPLPRASSEGETLGNTE